MYSFVENFVVAFTVWVISHVLSLLPEAAIGDEIRTKAYQTITEILQNVKLKSLYLFSKLMFELISCSAGFVSYFVILTICLC